MNAPNMLPDAEPASPIFGGSNDGKGMFSYPNIGSVVWCFFQNGDQNYPVYFAACQGGRGANMHWDEVRANITEDTASNGKDAYIHKIDAQFSTIKMWESGYIEIESKFDSAGTDKTKIVLDGKGNLIITSSQQMQVTAPNINIRATDVLSLAAPQIKVTANTRLDIETPMYSNMCGVSYNIASPSINMDATSGAAIIKSKKHSYFWW